MIRPNFGKTGTIASNCTKANNFGKGFNDVEKVRKLLSNNNNNYESVFEKDFGGLNIFEILVKERTNEKIFNGNLINN